jgi:hypothetical protein
MGSLEMVIMRKLVILLKIKPLLNENATIFETIDDIAVGG